MKLSILSIFPQMVEHYLDAGVFARAWQDQSLEIQALDLRDFTTDPWRRVDDKAFGVTGGMLFSPEPVTEAVRFVKDQDSSVYVVHLSPQGAVLDHQVAKRLAQKPHLLLIASRYEGLDARVLETSVDEELSIGDYVLTGGELAALVLADVVFRFACATVKRQNVELESFENGLLEYPHYTKPRVFAGKAVPDVLLSGDHQAIQAWRQKEAFLRTAKRRMDLIRNVPWIPMEHSMGLKALKRQTACVQEKLQWFTNPPGDNDE